MDKKNNNYERKMSSYIPNSGIKKPLNMLEGPMYPNIKKDILRFRSAGKHWKVDVGTAMKESEKYPMFVEGIVEYQSRDRNVTMYGQGSHRDYVNEEVRYPLISPWDILPESRKPRLPVAARMNPYLPDGYQLYQNNMITNVGGYINNKISTKI